MNRYANFKGHRKRLKAYRASGKMVGQAFNPGDLTEADVDSKEQADRAHHQTCADYNDRLQAAAGCPVQSIGKARLCACGNWTNGERCSIHCKARTV